jgi:uncharacterized protein YbjT (DUF2867 family)
MIAVMGAAGNVGGRVATLLLDADERVRVLEHRRSLAHLRERGADVVTGDAVDVDALHALFDGAEAALVLLPEDVSDADFVEHRRTIGRDIRDALAQTAVPSVVALSVVGADRADIPGPPAGLHRFERELEELDANVLFLRSATYMDYQLAAVRLIRAKGINGSAIAPDVPIPMVATRDVADEAIERLRKRDSEGHTVAVLLGPEDLTMTRITAALGARLGMPDLPYVQFPPDDLRHALTASGVSEQVAGLLVALQLGLNEGRLFEGIRRTPASTMPTRFEDLLRAALPNVDPMPVTREAS